MSSTNKFNFDASPSTAKWLASENSLHSGHKRLHRPQKVPPPKADPLIRSNLSMPSTFTMLTPLPIFTKIKGKISTERRNRHSDSKLGFLGASSLNQQTSSGKGRRSNQEIPFTTTPSSSTGFKVIPSFSENKAAYLSPKKFKQQDWGFWKDFLGSFQSKLQLVCLFVCLLVVCLLACLLACSFVRSLVCLLVCFNRL